MYDCLTRGFTIYIYICIFVLISSYVHACFIFGISSWWQPSLWTVWQVCYACHWLPSRLRQPECTRPGPSYQLLSDSSSQKTGLHWLLGCFCFSLSFAQWLDVNSCVWCSVFPWSIITPNFSSHKSLLSNQTKSAKGLTSVKLRLRPLLLKSIKETARLAARLSPRLSPNSRILRLRFATFLLLSQTNSVSQTFTKNYISWDIIIAAQDIQLLPCECCSWR